MKRSDLNEVVFLERYIKNLEIERVALGFSQREMAEWLDMSISTYKRVINGDTGVKGLYTMAVLYYLTGKFCFEFVEVHDELLDLIVKLRKLSADDIKVVTQLVDHLAK